VGELIVSRDPPLSKLRFTSTAGNSRNLDQLDLDKVHSFRPVLCNREGSHSTYSTLLHRDLGRVRNFHPALCNRVGSRCMSDSRSPEAADNNTERGRARESQA
jgi:hypothetical protein